MIFPAIKGPKPGYWESVQVWSLRKLKTRSYLSRIKGGITPKG